MFTNLSFWRHISAAPHRSLFLAGALQGVFTLVWWVYDLAGRYAIFGTLSSWSIAPTWAHAFLMIYGFFPFFIFGFLFTTYPNWMNGKKITPRVYLTTCLLMIAGVALFYTGLAYGKWIIVLGVTAILAGFVNAFKALLDVLLQAKDQDRRHASVTSSALFMACLGIAAYLLWLLTDAYILLDFSRHAGIWFFLTPILLAVSHRMIPFFSSRVLDNYVIVRPYWMLWIMLACTVAHGILQLTGFPKYLWIADLTLALCALYLSLRWGFLRSFQVSLLAVLHISFAWFSVSMLLYGLQSLVFMQTEENTWILGMVPLHALAIGYFASMVLGMASRVTIGHSGRPLVLDRYTWQLFIGFQAAVILRILPDIIPVFGQFTPMLYLLAGLAWLSCFLLWAAHYIPIYWRPRIDGKPG
ncbi:MAG: NnrS family protein [Burkholderiales bacterium]|nr:NnrS family protein [Nitrosomonas sp.]MCP5274956.1 NnrS family protein [Burkholderiales bacterium]